MKAYVLHGIGDVRFDEVPVPVPAEYEVLVQVCAAGVCGSDIPRIYQTGAHRHPLIPGHEFAGKVVGLGSGADSHWLHKRVGVFPLIPCYSCAPCRKMQYELCRNYTYLGSSRDGAFAEYVAVPQKNLLELPDTIGYAEAAMMEPMAVAVHAMRGSDIKRDNLAVICGLGTIGLLLTMFLKEAGISRILVIGNKQEQKILAAESGIPERNFCDSTVEDPTAWIHKQADGADVFFECVGHNETVNLAIENAAVAGKVIFIGNPFTDMILQKRIYWKILRNQLTVRGSWNSSFTGMEEDDWHYIWKLLSDGHMNPERLITHRYSLEDLHKGFKIMRDKTEYYGKIIWERTD